MIPGPLPLLLLPLLAGGLAYLLGRWRRLPPLIATGAALVIGLSLALLPIDGLIEIAGQEFDLNRPVALLGRALVLEPIDRLALGFLFLSSAGLFLLAWRFGRSDLFAPMGLAMLSLLAGVLIVRPPIYAALLMQICVALAVFPLHAEEETRARAGLRYLTFFVLAMPGLLVSHWLVDLIDFFPDPTVYIQSATGLIALSFTLMLGLFPFHAWVPSVGEDSSPLPAAFIYTVIAGTTWFFLLDYLQTYPWLSQHPLWTPALSTLGTLTAVVGGVLATTRRSPGALMGYAVMVDTGLAVVALAQRTQTGISVGILLFFARTMGIALMAAGLAELRERSGQRKGNLPDGIGWQAPAAALAVLVGGLSLSGLAPTIGFAARWAMLSTAFAANPANGVVLLLASVAPLIGVIRLITALFRRHEARPGIDAEEEQEPKPVMAPGSALDTILFLAAALVVVVLGLFPQSIALAAGQAASFFTFFGP